MKWREHTITTIWRFASKIARLERRQGTWVYRGQAACWKLESTLERTHKKWDAPKSDLHRVETELVREFRRGYRGNDLALVMADTCYCLALMRHYGAPSRFLDWTYSPFVAARFALDCRSPAEDGKAKQDGVVWGLNTEWLHKQATISAGSRNLALWNNRRDDASFCRLFMPRGTRKRFVYTANPYNLNERLQIQQGLFLCQGDISIPFEDNLWSMDGYLENVVQLRLDLEADRLHDFARCLSRMNVSSASLFPGLDGYAKSLTERLISLDRYRSQ